MTKQAIPATREASNLRNKLQNKNLTNYYALETLLDTYKIFKLNSRKYVKKQVITVQIS